ncbi:DNA-3-methyladenine glycosylase [Nocardioides insulae]|uniref:DNA-3-methyladenine glycosylase n=1 Tax=Nocardioides insulae TaxID=394734 RepID=UPI0004044E79|nr:DNA-3-methyladenine glycosylase [Nocardioides insulae]
MTDRPASLEEALAGPPEEVAPRLLGALVSHGDVAVRITEVEAYDGAGDPGSHAYRGRTVRNATMFGPAGHLYVYLSYGMHLCGNVVCGEEGIAAGCLLRAGEVVRGIDRLSAERPGTPLRQLATGPGRLGRTLGLRREHDGVDLAEGPIRLELGPEVPQVSSGPRVGLRGAPERPWRFWVSGDPTVSTYRPAKGLPRFDALPGRV